MDLQHSALHQALDKVQVGIANLDGEGRVVAANTAFLEMLGLDCGGLQGRHWRDITHPADHERAQEAYDLARISGRAFVDVRALHQNSSIIYQALAITGIRAADGSFAGYTCMRHDISTYRRNQEALMLAVESAPNGLLMLNDKGQIQSVNRAVETLFGYSRNELAGRTVESLLPERFRTRHLRHRDTFNSSDSMKAMAGRDLLGLRKDGVEIPLQVYLNRIETGSGELILCTIIDIAERVRYEHQLELAKQAAEAANRAKSDFLARMSHEIRTPMNLIMGMNALLLETFLEEKQRQHVEISYRNVRRLLRLINGILDLSKVEAGQVTLEAEAFDLREVLDECTATTASAIEQKGLHLEILLAPGVWPYWIGDAERLQQVLLNLIGNSVKFTSEGSIEVRVAAEPEGDGLRFSVSDTGCGVPPDKAALIFEAFQQADGSMNRPYEGTGLGLAIAKTIVQLMQGEIWVEQEAGPGATFSFVVFFPRATELDVSGKRAGVPTRESADLVPAGAHILVVEDNWENTILLRAYLEGLPLKLDFASNGLEAVRKRQSGSYDMILMDIQMPVMDGYTATREIRAWEQAQRAWRIPIVALTAHALTGAWAESMAAGCDGHVTKPVDRADLIEAIVEFACRPVEAPEAVDDAIAAHRPAFLRNRLSDLARMRQALEETDWETIRTIGHNCKGTGVGYGFPEISKCGAAIEEAARASDAVGLPDLLRAFEACLHEAAAEPSLAVVG